MTVASGEVPAFPNAAGDVLDLDLTGVTGLGLASTNGDGQWTFGNRQAVSFTSIENLADTTLIAVGSGAGVASEVRVFDAATHAFKFSFSPFGSAFTGGVRVATGDVNGDGIADIIAGTGPGAPANVRVFDGITGTQLSGIVGSIAPFGVSKAGVFVAAGDVNGDGNADIIVGRGRGPARVNTFGGDDGALLSTFVSFDGSVTTGVRVAAGDVTGDGLADIITTTAPGIPTIFSVYSGADDSLVTTGVPFSTTYIGGANVAAADLDGDGRAEMIFGKASGKRVRVFDGESLLPFAAFNAFDTAPTGGVQVAGITATGEILAGGKIGNSSIVRAFLPPSTLVDSFTPFATNIPGGIFVG